MCILWRGLKNVICNRYIKDIKLLQGKYMRKALQKTEMGFNGNHEIHIENIYYVEMGDIQNFKEEKSNTLD